MPSAFPQDGAHLRCAAGGLRTGPSIRDRSTTPAPTRFLPAPMPATVRAGPLQDPHRLPGALPDSRRRPVGMLLTATRRHPWRAAHIHARVVGHRLRTADHALFDRDSDYLDSDTVFRVKESLIRDFVRGEDGVSWCESDFVLRRAGAS